MQSKGTKSAKHLLKKRGKKLVQVAKGTERGVALEDLTVNKTMRQELSQFAEILIKRIEKLKPNLFVLNAVIQQRTVARRARFAYANRAS